MKDMNIKQILGANAHWTVNKELASKIGLMPTLLLQHLIDLDQSFFEGKAGGFYQQQSRLLKDLPITLNHLRQSTKKLIELELLEAKRKGVPPKYFYIINYDNLCRLIGVTFKGADSKRLESEQERLRIKEEEETKNKDKTILDVPSQDDIKCKIDKFNDDIKGQIYFKIVDNYPANRIGNRQHGLKKFKTLSIDNAKLAVINLKRYLKLSEGFHKSLQNYITEECWSEPWLKAEETKNNKKDITNTKTFNATYDDLT